MEREALNFIHEIDQMGAYADWNPSRAKAEANAEPLANHPAYQSRRTFGKSVVSGINKGYFRRKIAEASYRFSEECEAGDRIIVGVNAYADSTEERPIDILKIGEQVETEQCERLAAFKKRRDASQVAKALDNIRDVSQGRPPRHMLGVLKLGPGPSLHATNVMPALVEGALCNCTLGEMVQAMADVYARYSGGPEW